MTGRPFRFGVIATEVGNAATWTATARRVQDAGYDTLLLPDTVRTAAPLPALAAAAAVTTTLHVGTWVLCEPLHPRPRLLRETHTLDELFPGRIELGLGAGRPGAEHDAAALEMSYGSPGERVERLIATIDALRAELADLHLLVAASGPRLLRLAGRVADTVALGWAADTGVAAARERVDTVLAAAGETHPPELAAGVVAVNDSPAPWLARMATSTRELATAGAVTVLTGTAREMADTVLRRRDELAVSYVTVPAGACEQFAPVVELLAGR